MSLGKTAHINSFNPIASEADTHANNILHAIHMILDLGTLIGQKTLISKPIFLRIFMINECSNMAGH